MKLKTKILLVHAAMVCDEEDRSTEYALQYLQDVAKVDLDTAVNFYMSIDDPKKSKEINVVNPMQTASLGWFQNQVNKTLVKVSTSMAARTSYTTIDGQKETTIARHVELHDHLISRIPPHSNPSEHCARVMTLNERTTNAKIYKGEDNVEIIEEGWNRNFRGYFQYRDLVEQNITL